MSSCAPVRLLSLSKKNSDQQSELLKIIKEFLIIWVLNERMLSYWKSNIYKLLQEILT